MKKSSSGVNLDGVLLFGFSVNPEPLDNVGFIGTENIIGSNRWREGFSDSETRKLFLFGNRYICIPVWQQSSSGTACGFATEYFSVHFSLERLHH